MANRAYVYAIQPNTDQNIQCQKTFGSCRFVYNQMIDVQQECYKDNKSHLSKFDANAYCNHNLKAEYPFLKGIDKFALTNAIYHLSDGYDRFFKHLGGFPKYKSKHKSRKSYTTNFTNNNIEVGANYVKLPKLGKVKAVIHRKAVPGWKIKSATVSQNSDGSYQVSILYEYEQKQFYAPITAMTTLGLDYASDGLYVDNNGNHCNMPHYYRMSADKLTKHQSKLTHKVVGSNNYYKQQKLVAKTHRHIANQRKDFLHKKSTEIANQYSYVCVEDLNMRSMSNKGFGNGKATLDNGYGMFLSMLDYKLKERGGQLVKVDRWYPSSQICHCCGRQYPITKDLSIRVWTCPHCGKVHDRDHNAAQNIKYEGLRILKVS